MQVSAYGAKGPVDQLEQFNAAFLKATENKNKALLQQLVKECLDPSSARSNAFITQLATQGLYNKNLKFEKNMTSLISKLQQASQKVADPGSHPVLQAFSDNLTTLIQHAKSELGEQASASHSHTLQTRDINLSEAQTLLSQISHKLFAGKAAVKTRGDEMAAGKKFDKVSLKELSPFHAVIARTLKVPLSQHEFSSETQATQFLRKQKETISAKLRSYLQTLEGIETARSTGILSKLQTFAGLGAETEFGASHTGSLSRGVYAGVYNRLKELNSELGKAKSAQSISKCLNEIGAALIHAEHLIKVHQDKTNPETLQAKRALMLMKLGEFVKKCDFYLAVTRQKTKETTGTLSAYQKLLGCDEHYHFPPERLSTIKTADINKLWDAISESVSSKPWADEWTSFLTKDEVRTRPLKELAFEFINALEVLR